MPVVIAAWVFISFIYFKVALDASFYSGATIVAAALMAIVLGAFIFVLTGTYAVRLAASRARSLLSGRRERTFIATVVPMFLGSIAFLLVSKVLVFGFSKRLNGNIEIFTGYRNELNGRFVLFSIIVLIPLLLHYAMVLFSERAPNNHEDQQ